MVEAGWARRAVCDRRFRVGAVALGTLALLTALAPWIAPYDPARQLDVVALKLLPPTLAHPFGTDSYSRDVLSRVLYGGAVSLGIALGATIVAFIVGLAWGLVAGWRGGWLDAVLMRVVDAGLAFPRALVLLLVVAWWGEFSPARLALVLGLSGWFSTSRFVRAEVRAARVLPHVLAARALGGSGWHVVRAHVVPAAISPALVAAAIGASRALTLEARARGRWTGHRTAVGELGHDPVRRLPRPNAALVADRISWSGPRHCERGVHRHRGRASRIRGSTQAAGRLTVHLARNGARLYLDAVQDTNPFLRINDGDCGSNRFRRAR